jgi:hypothetical protein
MHKDLVKRKRTNLKRSSRSRGIDFDLSLEQVECLLLTDTCFYTGRKLNQDNFSIDRKDCSIGYVDGNVVACCKQVNVLKSVLLENPYTRLSLDELKVFLARIM